MAKFDFSVLYDQYPAIISLMPPVFDSHQFILELARLNQAEYIRALCAYIDSSHTEAPTPFQFVHRILSAKLREFPGLVEHVRTDKPSTDIFGKPNWCAEWRKVN